MRNVLAVLFPMIILTVATSCGGSSSSLPGGYRILAEGEIAGATLDQRIEITSREDRAGLQAYFADLAQFVPQDFDFARHDIFLWARPAPGPFGARHPHVVAISKDQIEIEWKSACSSWTGVSYALIAIPKEVHTPRGSHTWVLHRVPGSKSAGEIQYSRVSRGGVLATGFTKVRHRIHVLSSRDEYVAFLSQHQGKEEDDPALAAVDFNRFTAILQIGPEGVRRSVERVVRDGNKVTVFGSEVMQGGTVNATAVEVYDAVMVPKADVAGVTEWASLDDDDPEAIDCPEGVAAPVESQGSAGASSAGGTIGGSLPAPAPPPEGADAGVEVPEDLRAKAIALVAARHGVPPESLMIANEARAVYPLSGVTAFGFKMYGNAGQFYGIHLSPDGEEVDADDLAAGETAAAGATFGKLSPSLAEKAKRLAPESVVRVTIVAKIGPVPEVEIEPQVGAPDAPGSGNPLSPELQKAITDARNEAAIHAGTEAIAPIAARLEAMGFEVISNPGLGTAIATLPISALASIEAWPEVLAIAED